METISGEQSQVHLEDHSATHRGKALQALDRRKSYFLLNSHLFPRSILAVAKSFFGFTLPLQ